VPLRSALRESIKTCFRLVRREPQHDDHGNAEGKT
jgi:hypothetical protein